MIIFVIFCSSYHNRFTEIIILLFSSIYSHYIFYLHLISLLLRCHYRHHHYPPFLPNLYSAFFFFFYVPFLYFHYSYRRVFLLLLLLLLLFCSFLAREELDRKLSNKPKTARVVQKDIFALSSGILRSPSSVMATINQFFVIYEALCFDVAQDRMNGAPSETRTHSCRFSSLAC